MVSYKVLSLERVQHREGVPLDVVARADHQLGAARGDAVCLVAPGVDEEAVFVALVVDSRIAHVAVLVKDDVSGMGAFVHLLDNRHLDLGGRATLHLGMCLLDLLACEGTSRKSHTFAGE